MATKMQKLIELSQDIFKELPNYNSWTNFLTTAAWHYKYPFPDQVMIYKQRPDAKACASIGIWNNTLHRWVNKGTKGIALIHSKNGRPYIDYVFDISDTNSFYGNEVKLWEYNEKYNDAIIETLENTFGELSSKLSVVDAVISATHNAVEDNKADYLSSLKYAKENSLLEDLDELNIDVEFQQTAENSVAFMVLERLGYDAFEFFDNEDFPHIVDFNTPQTMHLLGGIVSSIAEQTLREVAETIRAEVKKERTAPKFFAENEKNSYNIDREENSQISNERNDKNGRVDLQTGRRLSDTEHRAAGEQADRQIRDAEGNILEEGTELPVQYDADERNIERTSLGDRPNSETAGRADGTENGTDGEHQRGTESKRPDEVDRTNEQPSTFSRRSHTPTTNLQLSLFPLLEEQQDIIREAEQATFGSAFSISQQIIDEVITNGSNQESTILNICIEYSKNKSLDNKIAFLRKEFEFGGKGFVFDDKNVSAWWNYDGMYISQGNTATTYDEFLTWEQVSNRIDELLELGRFAAPEIISSFIDVEKDRVAKYMFEVIRNINDHDYPMLVEIFKEEVYQGNYDDAVAKIKASLDNSQDIQHHLSLLNILETAKKNHDDVMRFRFYQPDISIAQLQDMLLPRKVFATELEAAPLPQRFITEDEINNIVCRGSNKTNGKYRIYDFFTKNTDKKARRDFLDKEFGWGSSHSFPYEIDHDKKGLIISRRDILSPFAKVTMKFSELEKRIDELITSNSYLTEHEKNVEYPAWAEKERQEQAAIQLHREQDEYLMSFSRNRETVNLSNFPKRLHTLVQYCKDDYEGRLFAENGFGNLVNMTELDIPALLLDDDTRDKLQKCLRTVGGSTGEVTIRNSSYIMSDELLQYKKIDLHRLGDFYEAYGEDAKLVAEVLELTLTGRTIDGERVDMVGFPQHNLILCNRKLLQNGNGWILGVPGSGKSFFAKFEMILNILYNTEDDIIIVDPEGEYKNIMKALGGEHIVISAASNNHINALEMVKDYGDGDNPINVKAQFIMSLYEQIVGAGRVKAQERSIIDRAVARIYEKYMIDFEGNPPTLVDFYNELKTFTEPEARDIALAMELFTEGSLNVFAHQSNVNVNNRIICYDILDLGEQLKPVGLLVMLDNIMNRVIANRHKGKYTHIYIDEAHLFFANQFSSEFLARAWKRFRKYGGLITGITQNVSECLASPTAKLMLSNSEFVIMLNQSAPDREELAPLMNISPTQIGYIDNAPSGQGVMRVGPNIIPFVNRFPRDTELYRLMTTKPSESQI